MLNSNFESYKEIDKKYLLIIIIILLCTVILIPYLYFLGLSFKVKV